MFNSDPELIRIGVSGMRVFLFMLPLIGGQIVVANYFQSIGKVKISMFLSLLRQVILLIPCLLIIPMFKGLLGVWLAGAVSDFIACIVTVIIFVKITKGLVMDESKREDKSILEA